jgi:hypothetical protein|uniref:Uncharacterized protein n=1 Tax=Bacteriophage sp. TaxID=38018 RepID=A0A7G9A4D6_9VIRU|nr:MAG: hypothetical protein [Bacteriophage sp.]
MLKNSVTLNSLSGDQKFFAKSYIIPTLIESTETSGKTFTDGEIAELYEINLTTARKWRKYIRKEWEPSTNLCCSYSLPKIWKINDNKMWERTEYNPNEDFSWKGVIVKVMIDDITNIVHRLWFR